MKKENKTTFLIAFGPIISWRHLMLSSSWCLPFLKKCHRLPDTLYLHAIYRLLWLDLGSFKGCHFERKCISLGFSLLKYLLWIPNVHNCTYSNCTTSFVCGCCSKTWFSKGARSKSLVRSLSNKRQAESKGMQWYFNVLNDGYSVENKKADQFLC